MDTNVHPNPVEKSEQKHITNVSDTMRKIDSGPSMNNLKDPSKKARQVPVDLVEEEGMESFPASDPPAHGRSNRPEPTRPGQMQPDAEVPSDQPLEQAP